MKITTHLISFSKLNVKKNGVPFGPLRFFNFRSLVRICESVKLRRRKCEVVTAKVRTCEGEAQRCEGESANRVRNFALSPLQLRTFAYAFFFSLSWSITCNLMQVFARGLPNALRCYWYRCARQCYGHRAYYESSLVFYWVIWHIVYQCWLSLIIIIK